MRRLLAVALLPLCAWMTTQAADTGPPPVKVLFLGDRGHHQPGPRFAQVTDFFSRRNIQAAYTENLADLNPARLAKYDVLAIYANHDAIAPEQS